MISTRAGFDEDGKEPALIRILIAEPTALAREGLVAILGREADIDLVATVGDAAKAMSAIRALQPDVALLATVFPADGRVANWIGVAAAARAVAPHCRCAVLSSAWRSPDLEGAVAAGVRGFLMGDSPAEHLIAAVRRLAAGQQVVDPRLSLTRRPPLTHRELDVLRVAAQGSTTAEIAAALCLSEGTVRNYLSRAIAKTGARNRFGAFKVAADSGWL